MGFNTVPSNPFPPSSEQQGSGGGGSYVLPIAADDTLGGIKVGDNLTIEEDGTLNADDPYTLPIAADDTLGGIKVGDNLTIEEDGTLNAPDPYTPPAYSTTPVKVATWIDGSDVMRVVYDNIQLTNGTDVTVDANFGAKKIIGMQCMGNYMAGDTLTYVPIQNYISGNDYAIPKLSGNALQITVRDNWSLWKACLIVDYVEPQESNE